MSVALGVALILYALKDNIIYYFEPAELAESGKIQEYIVNQKTLKVGGLVVDGSVKEAEDLNYVFTITDNKGYIDIHYKGILPPMFRGGQGVVAEGVMIGESSIKANNLLTKHDENYIAKD